MTLIGLLVFLIVLGLLYYIVTLLPLPEPFKTIVIVVFLLIAILYLLGQFTGIGLGGGPLFGHGCIR